MTSPAYRFGEFLLDPATRELRHGDELVPLQLKVFDCIVYLIEHRDRVIGRDELIEAVWGDDVHLSDSVLGKAILMARRALDDTGEEQQCIRTVRGYGYRWVAPVEVVQTPPTAGQEPGRKRAWRWVAVATLAIVTLAAATLYLSRDGDSGELNDPTWRPQEGNIALLLPVTVHAEAEDHHAWIRLGLMDLIAEHLRAAGQPMVPSDTVVALSRGLPDEPTLDGLGRLATATGAQLILSAEAQASGLRWRISLRSLRGPQPSLAAFGEAEDVLEAARLAADRMALYLGLTPAPEPDAEPSLQMLLQQIEAARLAQRYDIARDLIEATSPELRQHPEIRLRLAHFDVYSRQLDAAQQAGEALLEETAAERDRVFRVRILNHLAAVHATRGDLDTAEPLMEEAARLLGDTDTLDILGTIRMNLGGIALERGDFDAARDQMAQARRIFESIGDVKSLAILDDNAGVVETRRERYAEALRYFESAAERYAAVQDLGGELNARAHMMRAHLWLLDPQSAARVEPRVNELLALTSDPARAVNANLSRVHLLDANGQGQAARALLNDVMTATEEAAGSLPWHRMAALTAFAEQAAREGNATLAAEVAGEVVEQLAPDATSRHYEALGRAWLILVRARLAQGDLPASRTASAAMSDWANRTDAHSSKFYAALAEAELAAAEGPTETAKMAFEYALTLADTGLTPARLLWVAQSYVPWLLDEGPYSPRDAERALLVADRVAAYADRYYDAALLRLRVYHALGPPSAWRTALARGRALAGDRQIPPELLTAPQSMVPEPNDQPKVTRR